MVSKMYTVTARTARGSLQHVGMMSDSGGVAPESHLLIANVLGNNGRGPNSIIVAGIDWAVAAGNERGALG